MAVAKRLVHADVIVCSEFVFNFDLKFTYAAKVFRHAEPGIFGVMF